MSQPLRVLHFSDIHIAAHVRDMRWSKWFSKRGVGALNLLRGRGKYFDNAVEKLQALARFKDSHGIDLVINTGDYTALGLARELAIARELVAPLTDAPQGYVTVPGNHDIYVSETRSQRRFLEQFGSFMDSDLPEYGGSSAWPLVRLVGDDHAVVALNSARPNPFPWRSNGIIAEKELAIAHDVLADERLQGRFVFLITHYAPRLANGEDDTKLHGLINADEFLALAANIRRGAILCGHVHQTYRVAVPGLKCPIYCAGSATMDGHEGFWVYDCDRDRSKAIRGVWDTDSRKFVLEAASGHPQ